MVVYAFRGGVLELTSSGPYASEEWDAVFDAVRADPAVPDGAPLIIDSRELQVKMSAIRLIDRITNLRHRLGPKMGTACAMVVSPENALLSHQFRHFAEDSIDLRVGVFANMDDARKWIDPH